VFKSRLRFYFIPDAIKLLQKLLGYGKLFRLLGFGTGAIAGGQANFTTTGCFLSKPPVLRRKNQSATDGYGTRELLKFNSLGCLVDTVPHTGVRLVFY
jgi:hypothetical protein